jgi:hypothetical protein
MPVEKISYSQLSTFERCPELWYRKYVLGIEEVKTAPLQFGEAVHAMIAVFLATGDIDYALKADENNFSLSDDKYKALFLAGNLVRNGINLLFNEFDIPNYQQGQIEQHLETPMVLPIANVAPIVHYQGIIDFWFRDAFDAVHIIDWKTTSKPYTEHDIASSEQLTGYQWLLWKVFNVKADYIHYVTLSKYSGEAALYTSSRTEDDLICFEQKVNALAQQMVNEMRFKRPEGCLMTWGNKVYKCDFYNECWTNKVILPKDNMLKFGS